MSILRTFKYICCATLLIAGARTAWGFALLGPLGNGGDAWQVVDLGYGLPYLNDSIPGGPVWLGDIGGPKNIGEGYRRNVKTIYYAYDANFSGFFGAEGEQAADQAFAIMNNVFTNYPDGVDGYSADLTEFPFNSQHLNSWGQNLFLTDLKSVTLHLLVEQMGLAEPERYTWTLHDRFVGIKCPLTTTYLVVQRNFGTTDQPLTAPNTGTQYSPYVNNVLYSYGILDDCDKHPPVWSAITVPFAVDPDAQEYTSVAANDFEGGAESGLGGLAIGGFYTGLTRDDVAGLRYLMTSTNINLETPAAGSLLEVTNNATQLLFTSNLTDLVLFSQTNAPSVVETNFPGVIVASSTNDWIVQPIPNVVAYFTNYYFGDPPQLVVVTNGFTPNYIQIFGDTFANVITNSYSSNTVGYLQTVTVQSYYPGNPVTTNYSKLSRITLTNVPSGDYFVIPPGTCGYNIVKTLNTNVIAITNIISNIATATNSVTNLTSYVSLITYFTNHVYVVQPCTFEANGPADYEGIERVQFVRVPDQMVNPLTGDFITPITNTYTMNWYDPTNYTVSQRTFQRIVTAPDILLSAADLADGPAGVNFNGTVNRDINFNVSNVLPGLAGPGTIEGETTFTYNKVGTVFYNGPFADTNSFLTGDSSEVNQYSNGLGESPVPALLWASFDGSTNLPVVYPSSLSIQELENQMIIAILPSDLPSGGNGDYYSQPFTVTGGQSPYTWSLDGTMLPNGLSLDPNTGVISGTPEGNAPGVYDFTIQMTDSTGRVVTLSYSILIKY